MSQTSQTPAAQLDFEQLLQTAAAAARGGKRVAARALFLALSRERPDDVRVWQGLAAVAADPAEQRAALAQVVALEPENQRAREALALLAPAAAPVAVAGPTAPGAEPPAATITPVDAAPEDAGARPKTPFPLLNLLSLILIVLLLGAVGLIIGRNLGLPQASAPPATPILNSTDVLSPSAAPGAMPAVATPAAPTVAPSVAAPTVAPVVPTVAVPTVAAPTVAPSPTPATELPLGVVIDHDGWSATLLRPDYALILDGAIGDLQPSGRFVLAVVAVSNNSPVARSIPPELFTLVDSADRRYSPLPGASSAYLALYERGQRGDLAFEDSLEPLSGMRSVPILFDVPLDATGLRLTTPATGGAGWPISGGASSLPVGP